MLFNLKNEWERQSYKDYCNKLYEDKEVVEVKKKCKNRTLKQNSYQHVLISYFASQYGCSESEAKVDFFKRECNRDIFARTKINKAGQEVPYLRSSAELDTAEMSLAITRFRNWSSAQANIYLPSASDGEFLIYAQQEIERNKEFI